MQHIFVSLFVRSNILYLFVVDKSVIVYCQFCIAIAVIYH